MNRYFLVSLISLSTLITIAWMLTPSSQIASSVAAKTPVAENATEQMIRVQRSIDASQSPYFLRSMVFNAIVTDVRPLEEGDFLVGTTEGSAPMVAVLHITDVGRTDFEKIKANRTIVCPIEMGGTLWLERRQRKSEMLFEYRPAGFGDGTQVFKFGC